MLSAGDRHALKKKREAGASTLIDSGGRPELCFGSLITYWEPNRPLSSIQLSGARCYGGNLANALIV